MLVLFRKDGGRFKEFAGFVDKLHSTPSELLQKECKKRDLLIRYRLLDVREESAMHPEQSIMEVRIIFKNK